MRKPLVVLVIGMLVLGLLALAGCGGSNEEEVVTDTGAYAGKYVSEENSSDHIEIMANNTFTMMKDGQFIAGSCDVENGELLLSGGSFSETMAISGDVITDDEGKRFVKSNGDQGKSDKKPQAGYDTPKDAIEAYCNEKGIVMADLTVSEEKDVSVQDPTWEIDYAFPAEAEGTGQFFLLHNAVDGWIVVAHTEGTQTGWTAEQLGALGAPADLTQKN